MIQSLITALSMYSRIPVPRVKWRDESLKYVMCFFPLVGVIIGAVIYVSGALMLKHNVGGIMFAAVMSVIPLIITGGIHMDGFIDTADALSSYGDKEKRLEVMKDPHVGAFAIIWTCVYFMLSIGIWSMAELWDIPVIAAGFVISRALSGFSAVCFKCAKNSGLVYMFADAANKRVARAALLIWLIIAAAVSAAFDYIRAAAMAAAAAVVFIWHYYNCRKNFGGITGDLAGCFLQVCELAMAAAVILV